MVATSAIVVAHDLFDSMHRLVGVSLVLEHCVELVTWLLPTLLGLNLRKASSSSVRLYVSGKKKYTKAISKARKQQYEMRYRQLTFLRPMGLTKVLKKLARRPKSWKKAIPRERCA